MYKDISTAEQQSAALIIDGALQRNWKLSVFDGEAWVLKKSTDKGAILDALGNTGTDEILFRDSNDARVGKATLVWGNSASELIADSTMDNDGPFDTFFEWHQNALASQGLA